jgi:polysaccharide biosynthesis transport protein
VPVILFLALVTGAGAGLALAYAREWHARPARSGEQIERELGIHALGSVPRRSFGAVRNKPMQLVANACDSAQDIRRTTEALRAVRFGVDERCEVTIGCIVAIVSPNHGEGRSTIAFNLACVIAASGRSCLLLDADFRSSEPLFRSGRSLLHAVDGKIPLSKAVARQAAGFDYLGPETSQKLHDPTTYLGGTGMKTLLATARCEYDYVIVDTPAMLVQTDARVIAAFADSIVVVAEWGRTSLNDLRRALRISEAVSSRITGVVINKAPLGGH